MDRKSWPWMKKSSNNATSKPVSNSAISSSEHVGSQIEQAKKDEYKKPKYVQISVETYSYLTSLEDQVKSCEEQVTTLEDEIKDLNEKLSESKDEMANKDNLVKQHSKVAEEAVSGWEKAEAEADTLKSRLDSVTHLKLTAEDKASHLDGALKECMRQIRKLKEEHEQELHDVLFTKTKQFDKVKLQLESRLATLDQEKLGLAAENAALSRSLQDCSNMLIKLNEEKMQAEAEIEHLKSTIESDQKEINSLKYEVHMVTKEMEIRNEEKNMSMRSAEVANKQHLEGVKKIAKLEAECQRLRSLVRKKLPGPAAMAQMKLEVENLGRDQVDYGFRRSPIKPPTHHVTSLPEHSLENDLLTERLLAMEEETKMLKEALATRNSELQTSRRFCTNTASKLLILEAQMQSNGERRSPKLNGQLLIEDSLSRSSSHIPNLTTLSVDASDDDASCAGSWATPSVSEISYFKCEKKINNPDMSENADHKELMDDFLEMEEKLTHQSNDSNEALSGSSIGRISRHDARNEKDLLVKLRFRLTAIIDSLSTDTNISKALEDLRCVVHDTYNKLHHVSESCIVDRCHMMADCKTDAKLASEKDIVLPFISQELGTAISQVQDFIIVLSKEAMDFRATSYDTEGLSQLMEKFSTTYEEVRNNKTSLVQYVFDLSHLISKANELQYKVVGYKNYEVEISNSDCIDKVALPENKASLLKCSFEEFEELKSEKDSLVISLSECSENLKSTKIKLQETEQHLAEVKSQLTTAQNSNVLSVTQLKCMTESYKTLETRSEKLQAEVSHLQTKVDGLESELQEEKRSQLEALSKCKDLEDQLSRIESAPSADSDAKTNEEKELAAASEKLAKCQETIFLLGKQLNAMSPRAESSRELYHKNASISNMNCRNADPSQSDTTDTSAHLHKANDDLYLSTLNSSKHARHWSTQSVSSSCSSLATPDQKHSRGLSRFFSTKAKNAC